MIDQYRILIYLGVLLAAFVSGAGATYRYEENKWHAAIAAQQIEAAAALQQATEAVLVHERRAAELKDKLETENANAQRKIIKTLDDNRKLVAAVGLRDPGAAGGCAVSRDPDATGGGKTGASGARLSGPASEFLLTLAADADRVVAQLDACRAWAGAVAGRR